MPRPAHRNWFPRVAGGVAAALVLAGGGYVWWAPSSPGDKELPEELALGAATGFNVLLVTLDTTRADHIGCYGHRNAQTPAIDRLAAQGVRFADAVAVVPITLPSHASMLTGLYPPNNGVRHNGEYRLDGSHVTLAEVLREDGYQTSAFVSAFVLDARYGLDQGFDVYDNAFSPPSGEELSDNVERSATSVTSAALKWLAKRDSTRPFFMWVHYFDPHTPYRPPQPYARRFPDNPYDGEIAYMDAQVGRLLDGLTREGVKDRTLIIAVGDHGESLGEHGEATHAKLIYDAPMRVPLILACPALFQEPYVVGDVVVAVVDIFPTVLDLLGISSPVASDGISLLQAVDQVDRTVYLETMATYLDNGWAPLFGLRRHSDKYILAPRPEYYNLRADPRELRNLYEDPPTEAATAIAAMSGELEFLLFRWPSPEEALAGTQAVDSESLRRLQSLGYLSGFPPTEVMGQLDPKDMIQIAELISHAEMLARSGNFADALARIQEVLARSPHDRQALHMLGQIYALQDRLDKAEEVLRECLNIKPGPGSCVLLAQVMIRAERYEEAELLLTQAAELDPDHGSVYIFRGNIMALRGRFDEALELYEQAILKDPYRAGKMAEARIALVCQWMARQQ